ncbi:polyisoprenoid-binding protein YceI [Pontibacter ummariensis]|uniref:Polyisoprenoid-binding protein YceI n=1 Tax=Pontibacter ummariensis TaxID=1610492 RepID=A0A239BGA9_9BACT|nr:YceI family protein [Pontibacter ummariensis]PRY16550.1 polyisoprenoid-binding protein YceI [Pontibacter ummariensis]SNS07157.1 Polyisoprenoid-binding protein YceI [Pontibacter ummariensis]
MKKTAIYASFAAALLFTACGGETEAVEETNVVAAEAPEEVAAEGEVYTIVEEQSNVKWHGEKVTGEHDGEIELESGQLLVAGDQLTGGTIVIDMTTITNTDLTAEEDNAKLVGHLKSDDFFGVEKYPTAKFEITSASPIADAAAGEANYNVVGNLTIKDKTEVVSFPAVVTVANGTVNAQADVTVDRSKFDVRYGSESFFGELGDKAISDEFVVTFDVTAQQ